MIDGIVFSNGLKIDTTTFYFDDERENFFKKKIMSSLVSDAPHVVTHLMVNRLNISIWKI